MRTRHLLISAAAVAAAGAITVPSIGAAPATLTVVGTYDTGLAGNGAEIISIRSSDRIAAITNIAGSIDVLDISDPANITRSRRIDVGAFGTPNSVSIHPSKDYLLVAHGVGGSVGTVSAWRISDGAFLGAVDAGIQPDSIKISPNGRWAVVANEAEGVTAGNAGGAGSLSVVSLNGFNPASPSSLKIRQVSLPSAAGLPGFSTNRTDAIAVLPITNEPATLEPESVTFDKESDFAFVTLQENNGIVRLDLEHGSLRYWGLGTVDHLADTTNNGLYDPVNNLTVPREPDGLAVFGEDGRYVVTADEGDTLTAAGSSGPRGGRTVSVLDTMTGVVVDTGNGLDDTMNSLGRYPNNRSNRGGSEPEGLAGTKFKDREIVAVGLERGNAVALVDVTDPTNPTILGAAPTGAAPEGVEFFRSGNRLFVLTANEAAGTVTAVQVDL